MIAGKNQGSFGPILLLVDERILLLIEFIEIALTVIVEEELLMWLDVPLGE